ncbi:hypothetical protein QTP88_019445 [Uroleucon formosanum]
MKTHILSDAELLDILENDKWISSEEEFDVESEYNYSSDSDDGENEGNDLQNIVMSDYVGSRGYEVGEDLTEIYSSTNFDWSTDSQNINHFEYTATPGLKCFPNGDQPIDYFNLLVTDELLDFLVDETNIYAIEIFLNSVSDKSRISNWVNTNRSEMKTFLSLLFHMGTIKMPRLEDYWKTNKLFNLPFFRTYMSRNRFTILLRALHFSRNPAEGESVPRNRLHKIQPIVNYFNSRMNEIFEPNKVCHLMSLWFYGVDDKRDVLTISSEFPHLMIEIEKNRSINKPISVIKYNEHISGIDRQDQMTSYYPFERKTIRCRKKMIEKNTNTNDVKFVQEKAFVKIPYITVWNAMKNWVWRRKQYTASRTGCLLYWQSITGEPMF